MEFPGGKGYILWADFGYSRRKGDSYGKSRPWGRGYGTTQNFHQSVLGKYIFAFFADFHYCHV